MTTLRLAASACGATTVIAVTIRRAAKAPVSSDRTFLEDARWAPLLLSGNRLASSLPERHAWGRATVGAVAVGGEAWAGVPNAGVSAGGRRGIAGTIRAGWAVHPKG